MKKLNLEKLKLAAEDVLHRSQLAGIYGGSGSGGCDPENNICAAVGCTCLYPDIYFCYMGKCIKRI
jgi:hypothetical protein